MKKASKKTIIPDLTEFTDEEGKKWIQTSTEDLFSIKELNEILESIDKGSESDEIILARIDFQNVNKEYYETAVQLQKKLRLQSELLKKVITEARAKIDRKNKKLKELIAYIRKLHLLLVHLSAGEEDLKNLKFPTEMLMQSLSETFTGDERHEQEFEDVEEVLLPINAAMKNLK
ncbi:MAG: hypothetical protein A2176_01460 [Spirochaetes bacterium RBG_13_51_14]|nr:MAG: hypothetical protein A2176_01460 [Spirochaetes bacterium RBG_13_51_14]